MSPSPQKNCRLWRARRRQKFYRKYVISLDDFKEKIRRGWNGLIQDFINSAIEQGRPSLTSLAKCGVNCSASSTVEYIKHFFSINLISLCIGAKISFVYNKIPIVVVTK